MWQPTGCTSEGENELKEYSGDTRSGLPLFLFILQVMSDSLQPHGLQHTRIPCPSLSPGICSSLCPLNLSCHPTIFCPLLLLPSIFPSIRVFSDELVLHIKWPKYWSFSIFQARILEWFAIPFSRGIFLTQGSNLCLLHLLQRQVGSLPLCHLGSPLEQCRHRLQDPPTGGGIPVSFSHWVRVSWA